MPKIIDHDQQRQALREVALKLIYDNGIEHLSVRRIAQAANISVGAMRHYFSSQDELYLFLYQLFQEHVAKRIESQTPQGDALAQLQSILEQFLPLDQERYVEATFWLSFTAKACDNPKLQKKMSELHRDTQSYVRAVIEVINSITPQSNLTEAHAVILMAVIDGLTISHLQNPSYMSTEQIRLTLRKHLSSISGLE